MISKTPRGYQVVGDSGKVISADNLTKAEADLLVTKIKAYKASRRAVKLVNPQLTKNGKRL